MLSIKKSSNPFIAAGFLLRGMRLLTNPKLRLFILIPILINIVLYSVALALGYYYVNMLIAQFIPESLQWLSWILWPLFFVSFFIAGFFTFTIAANLIASPFYGILSAKTLAVISGRAQIVEQPVLRVIAAELRRALYIMTRMLPLFILFFIPVINIIASLALTLFGAWCLAMEFMAYPLENEGLLFADQKRLLKTVWPGALTFGALTMIGSTVPLLNIIIGPAAVIGSTIYVHEMREKHSDHAHAM
jgi:CysZ protein